MSTDTGEQEDTKTDDDDEKDPADKAGTETETDDGDDEKDPKWKVLARKHERENKKLTARLSKLEEAGTSESEKAIKKAREEAKAEALAEALGDRVKDALESAATIKLGKPEYSRLLTDDDRETFTTDDGQVDRKAINAALDKLIKNNPNLAKSGKPAPLPGGGKNGGAGRSSFDMNSAIRERTGR